MPLFSSRRNNTSSTAPPVTPPSRRRGIISRRSRSPDYAEDRSGSSLSRSRGSYGSGSSRSNEGHAERRSRGLFGRRRRSSPSDRKVNLARDQTLLTVRSKVADAEAAERSADSALNAARSAAREAKDHVKMLEREAADEYGLLRLPEIADFLTGSTGRREQR
jgi:hypothetical protein